MSDILLFIIAWFVIAFLIGLVGDGKKIGYWNTFIISLLLTPAIAIVIALLSPPVPNNEYGRLISEGIKQHQKGELERAFKIYQYALKTNPKDTIPVINIAAIHSQNGNINEAFEYIQKAIQRGWSNYTLLEKDADFANLRKDSRYESFVKGNYSFPKNKGEQSISDEIIKLKGLLDSGALTEDEFGKLKNNLLATLKQ